MNDCLVMYNERDVVDSIDIKTILQQFQSESSKWCKNLKCNKLKIKACRKYGII